MAYSLAFSQAISILLYVAEKTHEGKLDYLSTKYVSEHMNIPVPTASKILKNLNAAGLIYTKEGANGGIQLSRSPETITLLDIFIALEQERPLFKVHQTYNVQSERIKTIKGRVLKTLEDSEQAMKGSLSEVSLAMLLKP